MGNSSVTPMTRDELNRLRGGMVPDTIIDEVAYTIWDSFGKQQRKNTSLDRWKVICYLDQDLKVAMNKKKIITQKISNQIKNEYIQETYPYEIISINLQTDDKGLYIECTFQEETTDISFNSDTEVPCKTNELTELEHELNELTEAPLNTTAIELTDNINILNDLA